MDWTADDMAFLAGGVAWASIASFFLALRLTRDDE